MNELLEMSPMQKFYQNNFIKWRKKKKESKEGEEANRKKIKDKKREEKRVRKAKANISYYVSREDFFFISSLVSYPLLLT